jgi:predicted cupin superfamily sugar epimerase
MNDAKQWIKTLQLQQHPEGGWFSEVYRCRESIPHECLPDRFTGGRSFSTAIYFLLSRTDFSALHRIKQDEVWHHYDGGSLTIHLIDADGGYSATLLGKDLAAGERPLAMVPTGNLFGATVNDPESFALVGCTVAPGFDFDDFEMPSPEKLFEQYSQHQELIERLTRPS